jgi:uncharacterized protein (DUF2235 family)
MASLNLVTGDNVVARNLVVCIDGTGNHPGDASDLGRDTTNVYRLSQMLVKDDEQLVEYFQGVATTGWTLIDRKGEYTGLGARSLREEAYGHLSTNYQAGDRVFIFGFSRGAAIARDLANEIHDYGLRGARDVPVEVLGLWDTVAAFGVPIDVLGLPTQSINIGKKLDIPRNVRHVCHLVSIDEKRTPFIPTLVEAADNVEEVWFAGAHADVGGGFLDRKLADICLLFMIKRAQERGLRFQQEKIDAIPENRTAEGKIHTDSGKLPREPRVIVVRKNGKASSLRPKIHKSVMERMKREYQPANLIELNGAYDVIE